MSGRAAVNRDADLDILLAGCRATKNSKIWTEAVLRRRHETAGPSAASAAGLCNQQLLVDSTPNPPISDAGPTGAGPRAKLSARASRLRVCDPTVGATGTGGTNGVHGSLCPPVTAGVPCTERPVFKATPAISQAPSMSPDEGRAVAHQTDVAARGMDRSAASHLNLEVSGGSENEHTTALPRSLVWAELIDKLGKDGQRYAIAIPSGEGKTFLKNTCPALFTDHDDLEDQRIAGPLYRAAVASGDYSALNAYHHSTSLSARTPVLLTWGKETCAPGMFTFLGAHLLLESTGIRENAGNREGLIRSGDFVYSVSFESRDALIAKSLKTKRRPYLWDLPSSVVSRHPLFSALANKKYPQLIAAAEEIARAGDMIHKGAYAVVKEYYDMFLRDVVSQVLSFNDGVVLHKLAFNGQLPDVMYQLYDKHAPEQLPDYSDAKAVLDKGAPKGTYHGAHVYDAKTLFRGVQGKRRAHEYGSMSFQDISDLARTNAVVLVGPPATGQWLYAAPIRRYNPAFPDLPGIFVSPSTPPASNSVVPIGYSYWLLYSYFKRAGLTAARAKREAHREYALTTGLKKIGLQGETTGAPTKRRKWETGQARRSRLVRANAALVETVDDIQTKVRASRTEALKRERALDEPYLIGYQSNPNVQTHLRNQIERLLLALGVDDALAVDLLRELYPFKDEELLARTRVDAFLVVKLLERLSIKYGVGYVKGVLVGTGGLGLQGIAGFALYALSSADAATYVAVLSHNHILCHGIKPATQFLKAVQTVTRRIQRLPSYFPHSWPDYSPLPRAQFNPSAVSILYVNLLVGRAQDELLGFDGYVEKRNGADWIQKSITTSSDPKKRAKVWDQLSTAAMRRMAVHTASALNQARNPDGVGDLTPSGFLAHFVTVAPRGSIGTGKDDLRPYGIPLHNAHKRLWLDSIPPDQLPQVIERPAEVFTNAQVKTESGLRLRQIIPGEIHQWLIESIAMYRIEPALFKGISSFTLGSTPVSMMIADLKRWWRTRHGRYTLATDYADFNYLHTLEDMKRFWRIVVLEPALTLAGPGDWDGVNYAGFVAKCAEWQIDALDKLYVREVGSDGMYRRVTRSLWSGWRTTTMINNTMNLVYNEINRSVCETELGYDPIYDGHVNGDDGDFEVRCLSDALFYLRHLDIEKLDVQASKQLLAASHAEYLRIDYTPQGIRGSIARSCASFVGGDLQDPVIDVGPDYVRGTSEAINVMIRRGFDPFEGEWLRDTVCGYYAYIKVQLMDGSERVSRLTDTRKLYVPYSDGGYGLVRYATPSSTRLATTRKWPSARGSWTLDKVPHHGVGAACRAAIGRFARRGMQFAHPEVLYRMYASLASQGVDNVTNKWWQDLDRAQLADHLDWLNKVDVVYREHVSSLSSRQVDLVKSAVDRVLTRDPYESHIYEIPSIKQALAEYSSRLLGLASVGPQLLQDIVDTSTGERLTVAQIAQAFGEEMNERYKFFGFYPATFIDLILDHGYELPVTTLGVCPDYLLPLLDLIVSDVTNAYEPQLEGVQQLKDYYDRLLRDAITTAELYLYQTYPHLLKT